MSKTKTVQRRKATQAAFDVASVLRQHLTLRVQREALEEREEELKKQLKAHVEAAGYEDDKGHGWLDLDEPVTVEGYGTVPKLKRERRVAQSVDEDTAERILKAKGIYDDCTATVVVLDEAEIRKAHFKGLLSDADIDAIFPSKITYAFLPQKAKG
jgi:hypothetical protein